MPNKRSKVYARYSIGFILIMFVLSACANAISKNSVENVKFGRYAMQWKSYLVGVEGDTLYPQFAFIDRYDEQKDKPEPQFNAIEIVTDQGSFPASFEGTSKSPNSNGLQFFSALMRLEGLKVGRYTFNTIHYIDEYQQQRELLVGEWVMEVLPKQQYQDIKEIRSTIGGTDFFITQTTIKNIGSTDIVIDELKFAIPTLPVTITTIGNMGAVIPNNPVSEQVIIKPNEETELSFLLYPADKSKKLFINLRPMLYYHLENDAELHYFPLSHQIFSPTLEDIDINNYLLNLPATAYHPSP